VLIASVAAALALFAGGIAVGGLVHPASTVSAQSTLSQVVAAPDAQHATAALGTTDGSVAVISSAQLGKSVVVVTNAPPPPSGKTYELWYLRGGSATPAGTMTPTGRVTTMALTGQFTSGDTIGLTVEPAGGSPKPTTPPLFTVTT
jgi:anti-sigma-K factor RskA